NIRNSTDYRYSNLYVFLITKFPNNNLTKDTIECILADREGRWLGKGWGAVKENTILLSERMRFPLKGKYEFMIQHAMRVDTLKGIRDVGIRIVKSE
ncbi:MAG: gliding motility lipoprotein GldH, partial [Bacteroidetes bacterium]